MKKGKFFKRAALAAAVCLSLTQSVWAMPTGGALVDGGAVTGFVADPASGATFTTTAPSIINWSAFGIAAGESMTFNTASGALLNRVTGGNVSEIFGTLTQTGENPMFLVNPAGILVGSGATINASNMVLSTLAMSDSDFTTGLTSGTFNFGDSSNPGPLTIQTGANITANNMLAALGGTVTVADGVTFSAANADVEMIAAKNVSVLVGDAAQNTDYCVGSDNFRLTGIEATKDNALSVGNNTISTDGLVFLAGGAVNLAGTKIKGNGVDVFSSSSNSLSDSVKVNGKQDITYTMGADNVVTIKNATLEGGRDLDVYGGTVNIEGSTLTHNVSSNPSDLDVVALGKLTAYADGDASHQSLTGHTLALKDSKITQGGDTATDNKHIFMGAGKMTLDNTEVNSNNLIRMAASATTPDAQSANATATTDNTVTMSKATIDAPAVQIVGGKVDIADSAISSSARNGKHLDDLTILALATAEMDETSGTTLPFGMPKSVTTGGADHSVTLKNTTVTVTAPQEKDQSLTVKGGSVVLDGATLNYGGKGWGVLEVGAFDTSTRSGNTYDTAKWDYTMQPTNTVEIKNGSKLSTVYGLGIYGGKVTMKDASTSEATGSDGIVGVFAGKSFTLGLEGGPSNIVAGGEVSVSKDSKILLNGTDVTDLYATIRPGDSSVTPIIPADVNDQANIAAGQAVMDAVLVSATNAEERTAATKELVKSINDGSGDNRAKAAQVSGVLLAITGSDSIGASEKASLQREVVNTFAPTLNALIAALNLQGK